MDHKSQVQIPSAASQVKCFFTPPPHGKGSEVKINTFTLLIPLAMHWLRKVTLIKFTHVECCRINTMHNFKLIIKVSVYTKLYDYSIALDRNLGLYIQSGRVKGLGVSVGELATAIYPYSYPALIISWGQGSYCYRSLAATSTQSQHKPASPHNSHLSQGDGES